MMKKWYKLFCIVIVILVFTTILCSCSQNKLPQVNKIEKEDICSPLDTLKYISENYPNRTRGGEGELAFINYIKENMETYGFSVDFQEFTTSNVLTNNIICERKVENPKGHILLGLQWDNCYEQFKEDKPDGAYESGASISVALTFAKEIKDIALDFDLTIVYFSDCINNWYGVEFYLNKLTSKELNDIDLMVNLAMLGSGDNIYMYSRDFSTNYNKYFYKVSETYNLGIKNVPSNKRIMPASFSENSMYTYSHIGMIGCNYSFMNRNIPTISYLSINWEDQSNPAYTELKGYPNIFETKNDTLENMINRVGEEYIDKNLTTVLKSLEYTLVENSDNLLQTLPKDRETNWAISNTTSFISNIVVKIIVIGLILMMSIMIRQYVRKNNDKYKKEIEKTKVVIMPNAEDDIFNEDSQNVEKNATINEKVDTFDDIFE